ncbi:MAG TPA: DegV family protein [Bacteroidales bacterium]|jgi:DegV family protein with EDD domain|nr:DegV family EDD domain-containing protein [Bacteroidales bacterium]HOE59383.1 DegV family protein [Bacteroidales bacterium]HOR05152.1 DegV family protein [Bacteroidales bacterium]HOU35625.1 DegV family protein [Bacteroidales bacterium]HPL34311.1 DegV family protein [Bacteroidales bacterium]
MEKKIFFITADNLGLTREQIDYPHLEILKFPVIIDGIGYRQSDEYNAKWLISKYENENIVAKSSTLVQKEIVDIVEKYHNDFDMMIHVLMSSGMSAASFKVAENVRKQFENVIPIINIDSRQAINGVGNVLLAIIDIMKANPILSLEEIDQKAQEVVESTFSYFVLPDLKYLYKGGRVGKAQSLMGSILHIIPVVGLIGTEKEGIIVPIGKGRTFKQVNSLIYDKITEKMNEKGVSKIKRIISIFGYGDKNADAFTDLKEKVQAIPCDDFIEGKPAIVDAVYCGPGAYGVSVYL